MITWFGSIPLGTDHLTGPTADGEQLSNTFAEHKVSRGKPVLQTIGSELEKRSFSFHFDEGFCDVPAEYTRLRTAFETRSPAPLIIPGMGYRGIQYVVDGLKVTVKAKNRAGRLTRIEATIDLLEAPRTAGSFDAITSVVGSLASAARAALSPTVRR